MEKMLEEKISENLKFEIEHCGKKKAEIARAVGISAPTLSEYCSGRAQPTLANLARLCKVIGCSSDDILGLKNN